MSTGRTRTVPPAYMAYRSVLMVVALVLLAASGYGIGQEIPALWRGVLSMVNGVRGAWTAMHWSLF
jgi:hypothetical protein